MITICNARREKPVHPYDVWVCRKRSVLGNPYILEDERYRNKVCDQYEEWFEHNKMRTGVAAELQRVLNLYSRYGILRLFCWCAPKRCHAETIKKYLLTTIQ